MTQEKNLLLPTLPKTLGLKEDTTTEDSKENPINEKTKEDPMTLKPKDHSINEDPQEPQDAQWLLHCKITLFGFLVIVYDRVGDGDKFSKENFGLVRPCFRASSHLKNIAKVFS